MDDSSDHNFTVRPPFLVHLDSTDLLLAAHIAGMIRGVKQVQLGASNVRNLKISAMDDFQVQYVGLLGEVAVAKVLNIPVRADITTGGDGKVDLVYSGLTIQVKTSTHAHLRCERELIFNDRSDFPTDVAVSCSIQSVATVGIHGVISKRLFQKVCEDHEGFGNGPRVCVKDRHMTDIHTFMSAVATVARKAA